MDNFGLNEGYLDKIREVLRQNSKIKSASIFGSRAKGNYKPHSDVDIALYGDCDTLDIERVLCELEELPVVYSFDLLSYNAIDNPDLREHIDRVGVEFYSRSFTETTLLSEISLAKNWSSPEEDKAWGSL